MWQLVLLLCAAVASPGAALLPAPGHGTAPSLPIQIASNIRPAAPVLRQHPTTPCRALQAAPYLLGSASSPRWRLQGASSSICTALAFTLMLAGVAWGVRWGPVTRRRPPEVVAMVTVAASRGDYPLTAKGRVVDPQIRHWLEQCGLDVNRLAARFEALSHCRPEGVKAVVLCLQGEKVDVRLAVARHPMLLQCPLDRLQAFIRELASRRLKVSKVLSDAPQVVDLPPADLQATLACLEGLGFDLRRVTKLYPAVLAAPPSALHSVVEWLRRSGLDPVAVVNRHPQVLGYGTAYLEERVRCLRDLGLDPALLGRIPDMFGGSVEGMTRNAAYLRTLEGVSANAGANAEAKPTSTASPPPV